MNSVAMVRLRGAVDKFNIAATAAFVQVSLCPHASGALWIASHPICRFEVWLIAAAKTPALAIAFCEDAVFRGNYTCWSVFRLESNHTTSP